MLVETLNYHAAIGGVIAAAIVAIASGRRVTGAVTGAGVDRHPIRRHD